MTDIICYIKNEKGENELVTSKEHVNTIIRKKINKLTGGCENELQNLRQSLVAMWTVSNPKLYSEEQINEANKVGEEMFKLNDKIEMIVKEGRDVKTLLKL